MATDKIFITTNSDLETQELGRSLAKEILKTAPEEGAMVLGLEGNLGAGKTTFTQGFAKGLGIKEKILSPTFVVMKRFLINDETFKNFFHIDCYRLENKKDMDVMGLESIMKNPENIVLIEWPEKIGFKPEYAIQFTVTEGDEREITVVL